MRGLVGKKGLKLLFVAVLLVGLAPGAAPALDSLPGGNAKYEQIKAIYDNVARAFGDARVPPRLIVAPTGSDSRNVAAWSDPGTEGAIGLEGEGSPLREGYVALDERVWDLFAPLGEERESAVAFLLGHELTHYYLRHGWVGDFGNSFASHEVGRKMMQAATLEDVIKRETEADYFGGFYGHLAGYDTLGVAPRALDLIYGAYGLPEKLANYPARAERKAMAERAEANLAKMVPVFEAANRLLLLEKYEEAGRLYEHLAHSFPSRELFNNAGVAYTTEGLRLFPAGAVTLAYPFEFDAATRLSARGERTKGLDENGARRTRLLQRAADNFDKAITRDRGYAAAYGNLAAVDTLLGDRDNAVILANRALETAGRAKEQVTLANALVARGIAYAAGGNREKAMIDMAAARNLGSVVALDNLARLQGEPLPLGSGAGGERGGEGPETVGGGGGARQLPPRPGYHHLFAQGVGSRGAHAHRLLQAGQGVAEHGGLHRGEAGARGGGGQGVRFAYFPRHQDRLCGGRTEPAVRAARARGERPAGNLLRIPAVSRGVRCQP